LWLGSYKTEAPRLDATIAWLNSDVLPAMMAAPGVRAARNLVDRSTGRGRVGIVFSDMASLAASVGDLAQRVAPARGGGFVFGETHALEVQYAAAVS
jgi:hypothetical protein